LGEPEDRQDGDWRDRYKTEHGRRFFFEKQAGLSFDPTPIKSEVDDHQNDQNQGHIEMDLSPLMAVKAQEILALPGLDGTLGEIKPHQEPDRDKPTQADEEKSIYQKFPVGSIHHNSSKITLRLIFVARSLIAPGAL
jgi:hypothetical protein